MNTPVRSLLFILTRLALLAASVASAWAEPFAAQFQLEVGRVGHAFSVQGGQVVSSVVMDVGAWYERVGVLTLSLDPNPAGGTYAIHDDSTGESLWSADPSYALYVQQGGRSGFGFSGGVPVWMLVPSERAAHTLILNQTDANGTLVSYPLSVGSGQVTNSGDHEASALLDPSAPYWITDLTAYETAANSPRDLARAGWLPDFSLRPLVAETVWLEGREAGHRFTIHSRAPNGAELAASVVATLVGQSDAQLSFSVGLGLQFWLTREADGWAAPGNGSLWVADPYGSSSWSAYGIFPDPPQRSTPLESHSFRVNAQRWGHEFTVLMSDGYGSRYVPSAGQPGTVPYAWGQVDDWNDMGVNNPLAVIAFTASIDPTRAWWLRDETAGEEFPVGQTDIFDGWAPQHAAPPPNPTITIHLPATRANQTFTLSPLSYYDPYFSAQPFDTTGPSETKQYPGADGMAPYEIAGFALTVPNPLPYGGGPFLLQASNSYGGFVEHEIVAGDNDLRQWFTEPLTSYLSISSSRWGHELLLRHPNGDTFPILPDMTAFDASLGPNQQVWINSYYYFNVITSTRPELPFYAEDASTGERTGPNPSNPDLINWIALADPKNLTATEQPDGTFLLIWHFAETSTDGGFKVERRENGGELWQELAPIPAAGNLNTTTGIATAPTSFAASQPGKTASIRVTYEYGSRHSVPSNTVALANKDTDGDSLPDWWERLYGLNPNNPNDASVPLIPGDMSPAEKYPKNLNPLTTDTDGDGVPDTKDAYPHDKKRSEDLPIVRYIAIDISTPSIGATSVSDITLDETGQAAFSYQYDADAEDTIYYTRTWKNGVVGDENAFPRRVGAPDGAGWYRDTIGFVGPDGSLAGLANEQRPDPDNPGYVFIYPRRGIISPPGMPPTSPYQNDYPEYPGNGTYFDISGYPQGSFIWGRFWDPETMWNPETPNSDYAHAPYRIGDKLFWPSTPADRFVPDFVSASGKAAGWKNNSASFWNLSMVSKLDDLIGAGAKAHAISPNGVIFGTCSNLPNAAQIPDEASGTHHPYLYDGSVTDVFFLFPEKYRRQIQFYEYNSVGMLNNHNDGMEWIALWKGPEELAHWESAQIVWNASAHAVSEAVLPDGVVTGWGEVMNKDGLIVTRQWKYPLDANGHEDRIQPGYFAAVLLLPVEIMVVDRDDQTKKWADAQDGKGVNIYAGETTGDMVSWKLSGTDSWSSTNIEWSAEGPDGQTIQGPSGAGKNEWKIADDDEDTANDWLKWIPGKWKIKVKVASSTAEFEQQIGWRTEDYAVIGQIVQTSTHDGDKPGTSGSAYQFRRAIVYDINAWFDDDLEREAAALLPLPPEIFTGAWVANWGLLESHGPKGPFTSGTMVVPILGSVSVGTVNSGHRYWMVQTGLNMAPDDPKPAEQFAASDLTTLQQARQFRIMHRYQVKFFVDDNGRITGMPLLVGKHISDKGTTKLGFALTANQLYPGSPAFGPVQFPFLSMESEDNEYNRAPKNEPVSADKTKLSGYATARIAETGRNVNWRLFGKDAPWIFSEIVHEVKSDRTIQTTHRTSVDISWRDGSVIEGETPFNNLNIYKRQKNLETEDFDYIRQGDVLSMEGKLKPFIDSASGKWPEPKIPPSVK